VFNIYVCQFEPLADLNNDCKETLPDLGLMSAGWSDIYDVNDLAILAEDWLRNGNPFDSRYTEAPEGLTFIPGGEFLMGDHFSEGSLEELPVHTVYVDSFYMSRCEVTNQQYCDYLNDANSLGLIKIVGGVVYDSIDTDNSLPYCDTFISSSESQIDYSDGVFSIRTKPAAGGRDMSNDPMVEVSWYGAKAYCDYYGYRLPTEAQWEYGAHGGEHNPYYRFPWGDTISHSQANYRSFWEGGVPSNPYDVSPTEGYHPTWNDGIWPYTAPVGSFPANGYGLYDMAGNVWEWCNDWFDPDYYDVSPYDNPAGPASGIVRVLRGGSYSTRYYCRVASRVLDGPDTRTTRLGFRVVLDAP
jgi:formylglycine-generating enzyme required for sulfatase activity